VIADLLDAVCEDDTLAGGDEKCVMHSDDGLLAVASAATI